MTDVCQRHSLPLLVFSACVWPAAGQDREPIDPEQARQAVERFDAIGRDLRKLGDWSEQAALFNGMMDRLWEDNHWDSEPDVFARELAEQVTRIPPWRFNDRMQKMTDMIGDRYRLDAGQSVRFRSRLMRELFGFSVKNAEVLASQAREFIDARLNRRPFTPEQVARWTRESDPALADGLFRVERVIDSMKRDMSPEQQKLLQKDYDGFDRRINGFLKQRADWARGKWTPREWGLDKDPIHNPAAARGALEPGVTDPRRNAVNPDHAAGDPLVIPGDFGPHRPGHRPPDALSHNESTWARYVRKFIARHKLDAGQRDAALSILAELESRAADYRRLHAPDIESVSPDRRDTAEALAPIRGMFEELKARTGALLTRVQRGVSDR